MNTPVSGEAREGSRPPKDWVRFSTLLATAILVIFILIHLVIKDRYPVSLILHQIPVVVPFAPAFMLFICTAILKRKRECILLLTSSVAFLFLAMGFVVKFPMATSNARTVRVATYNVEFLSHGASRIADYIHRHNLDIFCLQESGVFTRPNNPQKLLISAFSDYHIVSDGEMLIGSKFPVVGTRSYPMPQYSLTRPLFVATINIHGTLFDVFCCHLYPALAGTPLKDYFAESAKAIRARAEQTATLVSAIKSARHPVILFGDFNAPPGALMHARISETLIDCFNAASYGFGYTLSATIPAKRIDFIYADRMLKPQSYQAIAGGPSDHCIVIVELESPYLQP